MGTFIFIRLGKTLPSFKQKIHFPFHGEGISVGAGRLSPSPRPAWWGCRSEAVPQVRKVQPWSSVCSCQENGSLLGKLSPLHQAGFDFLGNLPQAGQRRPEWGLHSPSLMRQIHSPNNPFPIGSAGFQISDVIKGQIGDLPMEFAA